MTIQKSDFSLAEQALIQTWIDTEIPARIASYQDSVTALTESQALSQGIEDIFEKIYASWDDLHTNGFLMEIQGLNGDYVDPPVTEAEIQSTATNPVGTRLFPFTNVSLDPIQDFDLLALPADFNGNRAAWTGSIGTGSFAATGYDEREALIREDDEWDELTPDGLVIRDAWLAEEAALQTQLAALTLLNLGLAPGQGGEANLASAFADATAALALVQGYIAAYPTLPVAATRQAEIATRLTEITTRVDQIRSPGTDQDFVRGERYYWLRMRINLGFGSLTSLAGIIRSKDSINARIADLQAELQKYIDMGF